MTGCDFDRNYCMRLDTKSTLLLKTERDPSQRLSGLFSSAFAKKVAETLATRAALVPLSLITSVLVARALGPEGRGIYAVAYTILGMGAQFGNLGLHASNTYYLAKDRTTLGPLLSNTLVLGTGVGTLVALIAWGLTGLWPQLPLFSGFVLALTLIMIPLHLDSMLVQNLILGLQEIRLFNKMELVSRVAIIALLAGVFAAGKATVPLVFAIGVAGPVLILLWGLWRFRRELAALAAPSWALFTDCFQYGIKSYLACLFSFLLLRVDLMMVGGMLGAKEAGFYSLAAVMADMLYLLPAAMGTVLFPQLSAQEDAVAKWRHVKSLTWKLGLGMMPLVLIAVLLAQPVIVLLYGSDFAPAASPFVVLALAMIFYGMNNLVSIYFASIGMPWFAVHVWTGTLVLNVVLNLLLIPGLGIDGAAWASLICYFLVLVIQLGFARHMLVADENRSRL
jgi:O-antigen/teichoic acid export membrane protein